MSQLSAGRRLDRPLAGVCTGLGIGPGGPMPPEPRGRAAVRHQRGDARGPHHRARPGRVRRPLAGDAQRPFRPRGQGARPRAAQGPPRRRRPLPAHPLRERLRAHGQHARRQPGWRPHRRRRPGDALPQGGNVHVRLASTEPGETAEIGHARVVWTESGEAGLEFDRTKPGCRAAGRAKSARFIPRAAAACFRCLPISVPRGVAEAPHRPAASRKEMGRHRRRSVARRLRPPVSAPGPREDMRGIAVPAWEVVVPPRLAGSGRRDVCPIRSGPAAVARP